MLEAEEPFSGSVRVAEIRGSAARYQRSVEDRQRYSGVFLVYGGPACGHKMHAHFAIGAYSHKGAAIAYIAALYDPYLAGGRAEVGGDLIGYEAERAVEIRAASDLVENISYPVFSSCWHFNIRHRGRMGVPVVILFSLPTVILTSVRMSVNCLILLLSRAKWLVSWCRPI